MGFSNVTGKYRPKRGGCETATQRKKRRYRTGDQETAQDIRVVKKQKSERAVGDRERGRGRRARCVNARCSRWHA